MTRAASHFDADNLLAARIYLADPERYGGLDGAMCRWARLVIERIEEAQGVPAQRARMPQDQTQVPKPSPTTPKP